MAEQWGREQTLPTSSSLERRIHTQINPAHKAKMTTKKRTKRRAAKRITLPELLSIVGKSYDPKGDLGFRFDEITNNNGRVPEPSLTCDTLAEFLIREIGDVFNPRAGDTMNLSIAAYAVNTAIRQLVNVEATLVTLLMANCDGDGYRVR
jgi:hypothetical protein